MPKPKSKVNRGLPTRWRLYHGAYYYRVPTGEEAHWDGKKQFWLGKTLSAAHQAFSERTAPFENLRTMAQLCDRYAVEVLPNKAPATQRSNHYSLRRLRRVFDNNAIKAILPHHIYEYKKLTGERESQKKANLDLEVLSHMFTKAIEWGARHDHPMTNKLVTKFSIKSTKAKRYVTDSEVLAFAGMLDKKWQLLISLAVWTGRRLGELLSLRIQDLQTDGILFTNGKDKDDDFIVEWTPETRVIAEALLNLKKPVGSMFLWSTRTGQPYIKDDGLTSGFDSIWQRAQKKAMREGVITERFTMHDLRRKRSSELPLAIAQALLRHSNSNTTKRHYRALAEVIRAR